jgi:hypothetical protein
MTAPRTKKIVGHMITVTYVALMVTSLALSCSCDVVGQQAQKSHVPHCTHNCAEPTSDAHDHLSPLDQASIFDPCCHCLISTTGFYPHIAEGPGKTFYPSQNASVVTLSGVPVFGAGNTTESGAPRDPPIPKSQIKHLRTVFLLI